MLGAHTVEGKIPTVVNKEIVLNTPRLLLVPFFEEFIDKYTKWMADPEILRETDSEPLTREDVQEIQQRYNLQSNNDYCFILCDRSKLDWAAAEVSQVQPEQRKHLESCIIGDLNLFSADFNPPRKRVRMCASTQESHNWYNLA